MKLFLKEHPYFYTNIAFSRWIDFKYFFLFFLGNASNVAAYMEVQVMQKNFPSKSVLDEFGSDVKSCCKGNAYQAYIFNQNQTVCVSQNSV